MTLEQRISRLERIVALLKAVDAVDFRLLCSRCHSQHAQFRELKPELLPYWFKVAMRLRDYIPPDSEPMPIPAKSKSKKPAPQLELIWVNHSPNS